MHSIPTVARSIASSTLGAILSPLFDRWQEHRRRRKFRIDLTHVDDRLLRDIGLSRTDVMARRVLSDE